MELFFSITFWEEAPTFEILKEFKMGVVGVVRFLLLMSHFIHVDVTDVRRCIGSITV